MLDKNTLNRLKLVGYIWDNDIYAIHKWLRDAHGMHINISPEYYEDGINWNVGVTWLLPKEEWTERNIQGGTFIYGDNGEYDTYEKALAFGIKIVLSKIE